jgi:acetolactate decarboxylase
MQSLIDRTLDNSNVFYAIKVTGRFSYIKTRSVPAQKKPYPPLTAVTQNQPTFEMRNVSGTLVGFRLPAFVKGINVPGYHVHFLSDDGRFGGHLLDFSLVEGEAQIAACRQLLLMLPEDNSIFGQIDLSVDRSQDLEKAEKGK